MVCYRGFLILREISKVQRGLSGSSGQRKAKRLGLGGKKNTKNGKQEGEETQVKEENRKKCLMKKCITFVME